MQAEMDGMSVNGVASGRSLSEQKNPNFLLDKHNSSKLEKKDHVHMYGLLMQQSLPKWLNCPK
jgi:hypothetical protein